MSTPRRAVSAVVVAVALAACSRDGPTAPPPGPDAPRSATPSAVAAGPRPAGDIPSESRAPHDPPRAAPPTKSPADAPASTAGADAAALPATPAAKPGDAAPATAAAPPAPVAKPAAPRPPLRPEVKAALDAARAKLAAGDAGAAVAELKTADEKLGRSADLELEQCRAFLVLADQSIARGEDAFLVKALIADAQQCWKKATTLDASVPGAAVMRARMCRLEGDVKGARETLNAQIVACPDDVEAHTLLAEIASAARDWQTADVMWTKVATLEPTNGTARLQATIAKQWLGMTADVIEAGYVEAARLLPDDETPAKLLNSMYRKEPAKAIAALAKAADASPRSVWVRIWWGYLLKASTPPDLKRAQQVLEDAVKIAPKNGAARWNLGLVLEAAGKPLDALDEYIACVDASEVDSCIEASNAIDRLLSDPQSPVAGKVAQAVRVHGYDAVVAKNPREGRFGNNAGLWFRDVGKDYDASLRYYLASVKAAPDDQDFLNDTGLIYLFHLTDRKEECRTYFDKVVSLVEEDGQEPVRGYWDTLENLCKYWFEKGDYAKVVALGKKRADPKAAVNGRPYPSGVAARYADMAARKIADAKGGGGK